MHYTKIDRKCYAEQYMNDGGDSLIDYKFWCFNGEPKYMGINDGNGHGDIANYDMDFNRIHLYPEKPNEKQWEKPELWDKMVEYAKILSSDFKFVRVDMYQINGKVYLGELTFTPGNGCFNYKDKETNIRIGNYLTVKNEEGVSICLSAYQAQEFLEECLDSIANQT